MSYGLQLCAGPQCRLREGQHSVLSKPILPQPIESKFRMRYLDADVKSYGKFVSAIPPRIKVGDKLIPQFFKFPPPGFPLPMPPIIIPLPPRKEKIMDDNPLLYISEKRLEELKKKNRMLPTSNEELGIEGSLQRRDISRATSGLYGGQSEWGDADEDKVFVRWLWTSCYIVIVRFRL